MTRPILYVCAPWSTRTTAEADKTDTAIAKAIELGWAPIFAPYALERAMDDRDPAQRAAALDCDRGFLESCDALLVVGERVTDGMRHDLKHWQYERSEVAHAFRWPNLPTAPVDGADFDALADAEANAVDLEEVLRGG